jgi:hypothetical protein
LLWRYIASILTTPRGFFVDRSGGVDGAPRHREDG